MTGTGKGGILVVGPSWVGDMILAQSLFKLLAARHAGTEVHVLAPAWSRPLLDLMPEVAQSIAAPFGHGELALGPRWRLARGLRSRAYDRAIVLPRSLKSALVPLMAGIPRRTGYVGEARRGVLNDVRRPSAAAQRTVDRFVALGLPRGAALPDPLPRPQLRFDRDLARLTAGRLGLAPRPGRTAVFCPGAEYGPAKRWPAERFARLARDLIAEGWTVWLAGSAADRPVTAPIAAAAGAGCHDLAGRTELAEAVALIGLADLVVTNDSGLMHVAAALDRPLVAIFGSSSPLRTPPLSPTAIVVRRELPCSPCFQRTCPLGHLACLHGIGADEVRAAARAAA